MYRIVLSLITAITLSISTAASENDAESSELQGYGAFSNLNKEWMLMALYTDKADEISSIATPQRLEIKIATKKFSPRRFRSLWLETLAVEHGTDKVAAMENELKQFFDILQGPLKSGDTLIIERTELGNEVRINYHTLANLSSDFLPLIVQSLVGKHPPTQALKTGLRGEDSLRAQTNLSIRFERLEPTLPRIAEISRWGKRILASR
jgi:hypothetical protein